LKETREIGAWLLSQEIPVYTFVNTDALSAGAILSLATDHIYMHPAATIGSAMPIMVNPLPVGDKVAQLPPDVQEKILSSVRALVRSYAQRKGHSSDVAEAMVDRAREVKIGDEIVCREGDLLNLTAMEAARVIPPGAKPVLAAGVANDLDEVLEAAGLAGSTIVRFEVEPAEKVARFVVALGPIFLALGVLGLFIEFKTPGFGVPGIFGLALIAVFFLGHNIAGLAGAEEVVLVVIGLALLMLEIFVIPGFGVAGISGIVLISIGTVMAMMPHLPNITPLPGSDGIDVPGLLEFLAIALTKFVVGILVAVVGGWLLSLWLPKTKTYSKIVLTTSLDQEGGYVSHDDLSAKLSGQTGVAATLLRPAGIAMFGSDRVDVVTTGELVKKGDAIKVVEVSGGRVVVEKAPVPADADG